MIFCDELRNKLNQEPSSYVDYNKFQTILCIVLNKHTPIKNKYLRANDSPFITKDLRKLIMNRSRFKNVYIKNKTAENWENYRKLRNECVKMTKKAKKEYFNNINIKSLNDNKRFWKIIKPNFTNKNKTQKIILVENKEIIKENKEIAEIFNNYFVNIVKDLNIPEINHSKLSENSSNIDTEPIDIIIQNFSDHLSILKIKENINQIEIFSFKLINEMDIETEIKALNSKKAPGVDGIPVNILKETIDILKYPLAQLFNVSIENQIFPNDLKYANVIPIF